MSNSSWNNTGIRRESSFEQVDYEAYGNPTPAESKRDKRRRDMVDRVSRLHADTLERRDRVFHDLSEIFARTADELLPPPVFPTFDLDTPVGQLPPSLPFTDPVIPDMHPTPYLFALHRLSLQRSNKLLSIRLFHSHQSKVAKSLYNVEVEKIEEEYEGAAKGVVERLLEGVEERRKRLMEEKEGEGVNLDTFSDPSSRTHATRRLKSGNRSIIPEPSSGSDTPHGDSHSHAHSHSLLSGQDPFNLNSTLHAHAPPGTALLTALTTNSSTHALANGSSSAAPKRKATSNNPGGGSGSGYTRPQPGLPPAHFLVGSGSYTAFFGKSLVGVSALRGEEIEGDLSECRRKRVRGLGGTGGSSRRNRGD